MKGAALGCHYEDIVLEEEVGAEVNIAVDRMVLVSMVVIVATVHFLGVVGEEAAAATVVGAIHQRVARTLMMSLMST
jgi:hypothetical protein